MPNLKISPSVALLASMALILPAQSAFASTACCPDGGQGKPLMGNTGLGAKAPDAQNLSVDSAWNVYQFEDEGVRYVQVNDSTGAVRAVVAYIGTTFWKVPSGTDRVFTTAIPQSLSSAQGEVVYRSNDVEISRYTDSDGDAWVIKAPNSD